MCKLHPLHNRIFVLILLGTLPIVAQDLDSQLQKREVVAYYTNSPIVLDGVLDEPAWAGAEPATDFIQRDPLQGEPATEKTEIRILYDDEAIYFGVSAFESEPDRIIINSLKEDFGIGDNDGVSFYIDTFNDNRDSYGFYINPAGAKRDVQSIDQGRNENISWEAVWDVKTSITEEGWFGEVRIPFKSLRFSDARVQTWGINFQRRIRRKFEQSFWAPIPRSFTAFDVSFAGDLNGIEDVHPGHNFKLKPFLTSQFRKLAGDDFDTEIDPGLDLKYSVTSGLTLDATVNTDFSQVEVDEQQINLTRFSLFFPEKRDFFLENSGIFLFAQTDRSRPSTRDFIPFFSRRIGLSADGQPVPVLAGARLSGRVHDFSLGFLNMQTREAGLEPANNFTVFRLKRNILDQSEVGGLFINRQSDQPGDYNRTFGVDASFRFWRNLRITSFLAGTRTPDLETRDMAGRIWVEWKTSLWEARTDYLDVGENLNAEVGFVPRTDIQKSTTSGGWRPRPESLSWIREFFPNAQLQYTNDQEGRLVTRITDLKFQISFEDGGSFQVGRVLRFERLDDPFFIGPLEIVPGDYSFNRWFTEFRTNSSARLSGSVRYEAGDFWDGTSKGLQFNLSFKPHYKFTASGKFQWDGLKLRQGDLTTRLVNTRLEYSFNTHMFLSAFIQYNSELRQVSSNIRFNFIHRPLSDIFIVYNEDRATFQTGETDKSLTLKYTHMFDLF